MAPFHVLASLQQEKNLLIPGTGTTPNDTTLAMTTLVRSSGSRLSWSCSKEQASPVGEAAALVEKLGSAG